MGGLTTWAAFPGTEIYQTEVRWFGIPLLIATFGAIAGWFERRGRELFAASDMVLALCGIVVAIYLVAIYGTAARNSVGTPFVPIGVAFAATAGSAMILELTRRVAGLALVIITGVFLVYTFTAHLLPGILAVQNAYTWQRFFGHVYSDAGILGPTTAVSSTYIILFIIFAAFLQASKVGDYFVNFAFAAAGRARGGPAKVAIFASGLMGMINGTSAGNVVATGSLTIPLMKKVGYHKKTAGAIEAAASTGGQIMPPIMGAGAFIMAEITGIPYQEIAIAAIIPAILYFASIYFMVDFEAAKLGMRGMREDELPKFKEMARKVFLFLPILILIAALFMGYSVIRAGTLATVAAVVVSWAMPEHFAFRGGGNGRSSGSWSWPSRRSRSRCSCCTCCSPRWSPAPMRPPPSPPCR
jgi:TRAP transporter 4TM/12TM fusion protein